MKKTIRIELTQEHPFGGDYFYTTLQLPAEEHEIRDAYQKVRHIGTKDGLMEFTILDCPTLPELENTRLDSPTMDELNFLALRLALLDDNEVRVLEAVAHKVFKESDSDPISMKDIINLTYGLDNIPVIPNIYNDAQLGQFAIENGMFEAVNILPDDVVAMVDKSIIGEMQRKSDGGCYVRGSYVVAGGHEISEVYDGHLLPETKHEISYAFRMELTHPPIHEDDELNSKVEQIILPADDDEIERIKDSLGLEKIEDAVYLSFDSALPQFDADKFGDMHKFEQLNDLARMMIEMTPSDQIKFKAVLSAEEPAKLEEILDIAANLNQYNHAYYVHSDGDFFKNYLHYHIGGRFDMRWLEKIGVGNEGKHLLNRLGGTITDYGIVSGRGGSLYELTPYNEHSPLMRESFELIEVLDQKALFTNERLPRTFIPDGLHKYDLRYGEGRFPFASIEKHVVCNHGGTVLTKAPIDFGDQNYIAFDMDSSPNFLGVEVTLQTYMDTDYTQAEEETQETESNPSSDDEGEDEELEEEPDDDYTQKEGIGMKL